MLPFLSTASYHAHPSPVNIDCRNHHVKKYNCINLNSSNRCNYTPGGSYLGISTYHQINSGYHRLIAQIKITIFSKACQYLSKATMATETSSLWLIIYQTRKPSLNLQKTSFQGPSKRQSSIFHYRKSAAFKSLNIYASTVKSHVKYHTRSSKHHHMGSPCLS